MSDRVVMASFLGTCGIITYRDFKSPDANWPLGNVPPPYRYVWAGVAYGLLSIAGNLFGEQGQRVIDVIAGGLFLAIAFRYLQTGVPSNGVTPNSGSGTSGGSSGNSSGSSGSKSKNNNPLANPFTPGGDWAGLPDWFKKALGLG